MPHRRTPRKSDGAYEIFVIDVALRKIARVDTLVPLRSLYSTPKMGKRQLSGECSTRLFTVPTILPRESRKLHAGDGGRGPLGL